MYKFMKKNIDRTEELRNWLKDRKELSINKIEDASGIPHGTLAKSLMTNPRKLPYHHWEALECVLVKYGWKR